jgi:hypothetical protein
MMEIFEKFLEVLPIGLLAQDEGAGGETSAHLGKANAKYYLMQKKLKDNIGKDKWLPDQAYKQLHPELITHR